MAEWQRDENQRRIAILQRHPLQAEGRMAAQSHHAWIPVPATWRVEDLVSAAALQGITIAAPHAFTVDRDTRVDSMRLCLRAPNSIEQFESGATRLERLMSSPSRSTFDGL